MKKKYNLKKKENNFSPVKIKHFTNYLDEGHQESQSKK